KAPGGSSPLARNAPPRPLGGRSAPLHGGNPVSPVCPLAEHTRVPRRGYPGARGNREVSSVIEKKWGGAGCRRLMTPPEIKCRLPGEGGRRAAPLSSSPHPHRPKPPRHHD